ncbi:MAG: Na+/H+ antiporter subunit E [Thermoleophilaceae bacterium]
MAESKRRRAVQTPRQRMAFWFGWWAICYALWLLLVFKTEPAEFVAGALAAALAATGAELVRARGYAPFAPRLAWSRGLIRLPRDVIVDTWRMTALLVRSLIRREPIKGCFRIVSFRVTSEDDPRAQARRIVAAWLGTISPNTYVIGVDEDHDVVVLHQLIRDDEPPELRPLG